MTKTGYKILSGCLCAALICTITGASVHAENGALHAPQDTKAASAAAEERASKEETVYVIAGADGKQQSVIVSDWLKNPNKETSLQDVSDLTDIENVKGDETWTANGTSLTWDAQGNDIYYQGKSETELPVTMNISYQLDGKDIAPAELAGKSGKVTIRFDYENHCTTTATVDGKEETLYVPFAALTGMLLDNERFTNIEVTNGRVVNDGSHTVVVGIAFPGLQDDLNIERDTLELPDHVEVSADVTDFALDTTLTLATNSVFSALQDSDFETVDDLKASFAKLTDAMQQLLDGSSELYEGLETLLEKSQTLVDGVGTLNNGAAALKTGAGSLNAGAAELANGMQTLNGGLSTLSGQSAALNAGAQQVFQSLLAAATTQINAAGLSIPQLTIGNYAEVLNGALASLDQTAVYEQAYQTALAKVTAAVNAQEATIRAAVTAAVQQNVTEQVTAAVREQVTAKVLAAMGLTPETYAAGIADGTISEEQQAQIEAAINAQMASDDVQALISQQVAAQMASADIAALIDQQTAAQIQTLIDQNMNSPEVQDQITAALEQASSGAASISALKSQLDGYYQFYAGLQAYTGGVDSAAAGAAKLQSGAASLQNGASSLYAGASQLADGTATLSSGASALIDGVTALRDGAMQLSDGLKQLNEEGFQKLVDAMDGDVEPLLERARALAGISGDYQTYSGLDAAMDGSVKFIYRTEAIG